MYPGSTCVRTAVGALALMMFVGCSSTTPRPSGYQLVKPTVIDQAYEEVPEDQLLDVGVATSMPRALTGKKLEKLGTNPDIRKSEAHYIPYHLKNTLQTSSQWGAVRVVPSEHEIVDLKVNTEIVASNGEVLQIEMTALDTTGRVWMKRKYHAEATVASYDTAEQGGQDPFQDMYNTIANDLTAFKRSLTPEEIRQIRTASKLRFAQELAPDAFGHYLAEDETGRVTVQRLPADDDPNMQRVATIREREDMFLDTMNQYSEGYYVDMRDAYDNWRRYNHVELEALREVEREGFVRTLAGIAMIAGAVALGSQDSGMANVGSGILILGGGQVLVSGINISEQADIHAEAIQELSESFGSEMRPTVMELEGKQYELTGTVDEQYMEWKHLLRRIYFEETGFDPDIEQYGDVDAAPATTPTGS